MLPDHRLEFVVREEVAVGVRRGGEPVRDAHPGFAECTDEFAERCIPPADAGDIVVREVSEGQDARVAFHD